jgi:hypothetical protein
MRYHLYHNDVGYHLIVDTLLDQIIGKIRSEKQALRIVQKLNRAVKEERLNAKIH